MSLDKKKFLNLMGNEEAQQFMKSMESSGQDMFAALEPQSRKIEGFLNEIEDKLAEGPLSKEDAKVYLDDLIERHDLPLSSHEYHVWSTKLVGKLANSGLSGIQINHQDFPTLSLNEGIKGGLKKRELAIFKANGQEHRSVIGTNAVPPLVISGEINSTTIASLKHLGAEPNTIPLVIPQTAIDHLLDISNAPSAHAMYEAMTNFIKSVPGSPEFEIEGISPSALQRLYVETYAKWRENVTPEEEALLNTINEGFDTFSDRWKRIATNSAISEDFIVRPFDTEGLHELRAFDAVNRHQILNTDRSLTTKADRNKRKAKNKAASKARRKSRK